jgi:thiosulfate/3-mercaptopyruvate sulfurtransferase
MSHTTLVSSAELAQHLDDPLWVVVDCRHDLASADAGEKAYAAGHIPGARFMHGDRDLAAPLTGRNGRHPLPAPGVFMQTLAKAGITPASQVIAYDAQGGIFASRLWWMLRHWLGHERVAVLDGGWGKWIAEARPQSTDLPGPATGAYHAVPRNNVVDAADVLAQLGQPGMLLIDARAADRYRGENETLDPVGGHIPGARNRFFRDNLEGSGQFKTTPALRAEFETLLAGTPASQVVHQCGSGITACHNALAMDVAGLTGFGGQRVYAGSWSEWCADPARPVRTGPAP